MVVSGDSPKERNEAGAGMRMRGQPHLTAAGCDGGQRDTVGLSYMIVHHGLEKPQNGGGPALSMEIP